MVDLIMLDLPSNYLTDLSKSLSQNNIQSSANLILSDCFFSITSKTPALTNLQKILGENPTMDRLVLVDIYNKFLGIISVINKTPISVEEFKAILISLNVPDMAHEDCIKPYVEFLEIIKLKKGGIEGATKLAEKEKERGKINEQFNEDYLNVKFAEIVNVEWSGLQEICSMHMAGIYESKFIIKIFILTNEMDTGVTCKKKMTESLHELKLKMIEFKCSQAELQHLLYKVSEGLNEVNKLVS